MSVALGALKDYVRGPSSQNQADDTVLMQVSHSNLKATFQEIRFDLHTTVGNVKERLRTHTGTPVEAMLLQLLDDNNVKLFDLADDNRPLESITIHISEHRLTGESSVGPIQVSRYRIHVIDLDPGSLAAGGWLEDTSLIEKYTISDEAYNKRNDTYRKFKEQRLAEDPTWTLEKEMAARRNEPLPEVQRVDNDYLADIAASIKVGDRCEIDPGAKRGEVKFVGRADTLAAGFWVGVQYDEPVGKHDGLVKGKRYFTSPPQCGSMLRPDRVKVGDYPERDPFEEEEI